MARPRTLHDTITIAPGSASVADPFGDGSPEDKEAADAGRRGILVRVDHETHRALKFAAVERGTTVQTLMLDAVALVLGPPADEPTANGPTGP